MEDGAWQTVHRRKRFPDNWRTPANEELDKVRPYVPYKRTYAHVVANSKPRPSTSSSSSHSQTHSRPSPPSNPISRSQTPPTPPASQTPPSNPAARYYKSPHSPTNLRFPPMASYPEWRGRCFRCLRMGHSAANCCNPFKCAKCWLDGHIASRCNTNTNTTSNPATQPSQPAAQPPRQMEPSFDELLQGDELPPNPVLPEGRPEKVMCFIERDEEVCREIQNLSRAVVIHGERQGLLLEAHAVVKIAVETGLVREEEIRVAQLARERYLIHLPRGLLVDTFVKALPRWLWDQGFDIQQWSPHDGARVVMPRFKVLFDLEDFPIYLWKEKQIIKAVSQFGIFLGSVQPEHATDYTAWRISVATDDLSRVPMVIGIVAGGLKYQSKVTIISWSQGPIYSASDFPEIPRRFAAPPPSPPSSQEDDLIEAGLGQPGVWEDDELIPCSRKALREICQGLDPDAIPPELRELIFGARPAGDIPYSAIRELLEATENPTNPCPIPDQNQVTLHLTGQEGMEKNTTTHGAARLGDNMSKSNTPTVIRNQNHPGSMSDACSQYTTNQEPEEAVMMSAPSSIPQVQFGKESKIDQAGRILAAKSTSQMGGAGPKPPIKPNHASSSTSHQPQNIFNKQKGGIVGQRQQSKSATLQALCTSRHTRFAAQAGKGKGRARHIKQKPGAGQDLTLTGHNAKDTELLSPQSIRTQPRSPAASEMEDPIQRAEVQQAQNSNRPAKDAMGQIILSAPRPTQVDQRKGSGQFILKRKPATQSVNRTGPSPSHEFIPIAIQPAKKLKQQAGLNLNAAGYYEAQVDDELCANIGKGCGLTAEDVFQALVEDNRDRELAATECPTASASASRSLQWEEQVNIDPDSDEDLDSIDV